MCMCAFRTVKISESIRSYAIIIVCRMKFPFSLLLPVYSLRCSIVACVPVWAVNRLNGCTCVSCGCVCVRQMIFYLAISVTNLTILIGLKSSLWTPLHIDKHTHMHHTETARPVMASEQNSWNSSELMCMYWFDGVCVYGWFGRFCHFVYLLPVCMSVSYDVLPSSHTRPPPRECAYACAYFDVCVPVHPNERLFGIDTTDIGVNIIVIVRVCVWERESMALSLLIPIQYPNTAHNWITA